MKYKTTRKDIKARYNKVLSIGYCNIQSLLKMIPIQTKTFSD